MDRRAEESCWAWVVLGLWIIAVSAALIFVRMSVQ